MTPREKLIENIQSIIDGTAMLTLDMDSSEPLLLNPDKIAEAIIDYLKLEVVDNKSPPLEKDVIQSLLFKDVYYLDDKYQGSFYRDNSEILQPSDLKTFNRDYCIIQRKNNPIINIDNL